MLQRLGIKYVSGSVEAVSEKTSIPAQTPAPTEAVLEEVPPPSVREVPSADTGAKPKWLSGTADTIQAMELTAFDRDICECQKCPLGRTRKNFVFGMGNPQAEILFIGE